MSKNSCFTAEFERRLSRLGYAIADFHDSGLSGNVLPRLFSCVSYVWCRSPFKSKKAG